jgi:hypothetical protein
MICSLVALLCALTQISYVSFGSFLSSGIMLVLIAEMLGGIETNLVRK